ncbi:ABC transporter ATP-binding protein/permease [Streptomyces mirabilis]|uniref:ABC transporter ATP-binding protein/permease n=1 Tax=Streptomyces mirabilis TaxID=68239 RepID=UPI0033311A35
MGLRKKRHEHANAVAAGPGPTTDWAVELRGVRRQYGRGGNTVHALRGLDLALPHGSFTAIMGPSGSGKSTFLQCAAGLDRPTAGTVHLGGTDITGMSENKLTALRRTRLGFVFQAFNLLPSLTVEQNVVLPTRLAGHRPDRHRAAEVLAQVGLADKARRRPGQLSDGTEASPTLVATYGRGLGLSQVTFARADLARHVTDSFDSEIWTKGGTAAGLSGLGTVRDRADHTIAESRDRALNAWANTVMAAVLGGFAAVAAANTLVMTVLDRRDELGTLRLIGSTRRQVLRMIRWEALLVVLAGIVLGTAIALATLVPMMKGLTGQGPYIPPLLYGSFAGAVVMLGLTAVTVPARAALRRETLEE